MTVRRILPLSLLTIGLAALAVVAGLVSRHTIEVVEAERLLPRWDLATHLVHGWTDYYYLKTLRLQQLVWDLWLQGYWPPVHSIYQIPFYLVLGGGMSSGLWSSLTAFVLVGLTGISVLHLQWRRAAVLPAGLFLMFLVTSPFHLAYASVAMTEMLGALVQVSVLFCYLRYHLHPGPRAARLFAVSLTVLFFTKYNYFFLLTVPLLVHEYLGRTAGWSRSRRLGRLWRWTKDVLSTGTGAVVGIYLAALLAVTLTGGFELDVFGQRISVRTVGSSGYVVLYGVLGRLWFLHRRGRIDWRGLFATDPRIRPVLVWLALPVIIWFAFPYPNHIREFANLVINRPMGEPTIVAGVAMYVDAIRRTFFDSDWLLVTSVAVFAVAVVRYRKQPLLMQWLLLAVPFQLAAMALHQTRFGRFLVPTLVLLWLAVSGEVGSWSAGSKRRRLVASLVAPLVLGYGLATAHGIVTQERFRRVAFENYSDSASLAAAIASIRDALGPDDRLAILGQSNDLSPGLFRWELGPPSGVPRFPIEIGTGNLDALDTATQILLIAPGEPGPASSEVSSRYPLYLHGVRERVERGEFVFQRELPVADQHVTFQLYQRTRSR